MQTQERVGLQEGIRFPSVYALENKQAFMLVFRCSFASEFEGIFVLFPVRV